MRLARFGIICPQLCGIICAALAEKLPDHAHCAAGICHINRWTRLIGRLNFHRCMGLGRCRPANEQRQLHAAPLHLLADINHLVEARRNETRQANHIDIMLNRGVENFIAGHHDAEVDNIITVTLENHADDIFADVMHVALYGRHQDFTVGRPCGSQLFLLRFHKGHEMGDRGFHNAGGFHNLRQEHFACAEQIANDIHAVHQGAFNDMKRPLCILAGFLCVGDNVVRNPAHKRMF